MHTEKCTKAQPSTSNVRDITYSQANKELRNTDKITNELDGAERGDVPSLNRCCDPQHSTVEARVLMMY